MSKRLLCINRKSTMERSLNIWKIDSTKRSETEKKKSSNYLCQNEPLIARQTDRFNRPINKN